MDSFVIIIYYSLFCKHFNGVRLWILQEFSINIDDSCISESFWRLVFFPLKGFILIDFDESFRGLKSGLTLNLLQFHVWIRKKGFINVT